MQNWPSFLVLRKTSDRVTIVDSTKEVLQQHLAILAGRYSQDSGERLPSELDDAISGFVAELVQKASKSRMAGGRSDEIGFHKITLPDPNTIEIRGLMAWEPRYWIEPFYAKLWLRVLPDAEIGYDVHFGAAEEPTIRYDSEEYNGLINEIILVSREHLDERDFWAFSFLNDSN